jgi:cytoskeleton protein RodZ
MNNAAINQQTESEVNQESSVEDNSASLGGLLSQAREALGVPLDRVADELKIPESKLKALELGDYSKLASPTFVKGYLRTYSRYLNLSVDDIIRRYEYISGHEESTVALENKTVSRLEPIEKPFPELRWPLAIGAVILSLIAGYILWGDDFMRWAEGGAETSSTELTVTEPSEPSSTQISVTDVIVDPLVSDSIASNEPSDDQNPEATLPQAALVSPQVSTPQISTSTEPVETNSAALSFASASQSLTASSQVNPVSEEPSVTAENNSTDGGFSSSILNSEDTLTFDFSGDCWLEVKSSDDTILYSGVAKLDQTLELTGNSPFSVRLGNARVVSLLHNGEAVAINPIPGRNTLRFQVGQ